MNANSNLTVNITANTANFVSKMRGLNSTLQRSQKSTGAYGGLLMGVGSQFKNLTGAMISANVVMRATRIAIDGVKNAFIGGFMAAESFNMRVTQSAALLSSVYSSENNNIADVFQQALNYASDLQETFVEINNNTLATVKQMNLVNLELNKQGVQIDLNNAKSVKGFETLTNAIAVLTSGMHNQNLQFGQEIRALLEGNIRQGSTLALFLKQQLGPNTKQIVEEWKKSGAFLQKVSQYLKGFDEASGRIQLTWVTIYSTFQSMMEFIMKEGFQDFYEVIIEKGKLFNDYLVEHKNRIADMIRELLSGLTSFIRSINEQSIRDALDYIQDKFAEIKSHLKKIAIVVAVIVGLNLVVWLVNVATAVKSLSVALFALGMANPPLTILATTLALIAGLYLKMRDNKKKYMMLEEEKTDEQLNKDKKRYQNVLKFYKDHRKEAEDIYNIQKKALDKDGKPLNENMYRIAENAYFNALQQEREILAKIANLDAIIESRKPKPKTKPKPGSKADILKDNFVYDKYVEEPHDASKNIWERLHTSMMIYMSAMKTSTEQMALMFASIGGSFVNFVEGSLSAGIKTLWKDQKDITEAVQELWSSMFDRIADEIAKFLAIEAVRIFFDFIVPGLGSLLATIAGSASTPGKGSKGHLPNYKPSYNYSPFDYRNPDVEYPSSFAVGTSSVSKDQLAYIHKGEMIVPAAQSEAIRQGNTILSSNSNLEAKLDALIQVSAANKYAIIDESGLTSVTRAINRKNFEFGRYGLA